MNEAKRKAWATRRAKYGPMGHKMTEQIRDAQGLLTWLKTQAITKARKHAIDGNPNDHEVGARFQAVADLLEGYALKLGEIRRLCEAALPKPPMYRGTSDGRLETLADLILDLLPEPPK